MKAVEAFVGLKEDVSAHVGIMISAAGFSRAARNLAERKQINLFSYRDTKKETWPNGLKVPVTQEAWILKPLSLYQIKASGERIDFASDADLELRDFKTDAPCTLVDVCESLWQKHEPKTDGEFCWEIRTGKEKDALDEKLGVGFSARLRRTVREGRMHFQGLVNAEKGEAHAPSFRIEVTGEPKEVSSEHTALSARHAGYGLLMKTTLVETKDRATQALDKLMLTGHMELAVKSTGAIPISLAQDRPSSLCVLSARRASKKV